MKIEYIVYLWSDVEFGNILPEARDEKGRYPTVEEAIAKKQELEKVLPMQNRAYAACHEIEILVDVKEE